MDQPGDRPTQQLDDDPFTDGRLARAALDAIPVAMWLKDLDGRYLACNRRFEQLLGVEEADLVGRPSSDFVDAETAEVFRRQDRLALSIGKPVTHEQWVVDRLDDRRKLWETTKSTVRDIDGTAIGVLGISFDVTDRDEMYRQLVDETQRFEAAERLADTGSWDEDVVAGTSQWTRGVFDIFGLDPATTVPDRRVIIDLIHPDDREAVVRVTEEGRRHGQPYAQRYRALVDGRVKHIEGRGYPRLGVDGQLVRVTGTVQDITDRAVAAQQLTERQAEIERAADDWATLLTGNHDGFLLVDRQGRVLEVSEPFCRLSGLHTDDVVGRSMADLNPYVDEAELVAGMDAFAAAGGGVVPGVVRHADGTDIPVDVSVTFTERDGGRFFTFVRDKREQVRLNAEVEQSARRFRALLDASSDGVIIIGHDNRLTDVNARYLELSGFARDDVLGMSIADLDARFDEHQLGAFRARTAELGTVIAESVHRRKDGSLWPVEVTATATGDETEEFSASSATSPIACRPPQRSSRRRTDTRRSSTTPVTASPARHSTASSSRPMSGSPRCSGWNQAP